jgi:hypothetical protein
MPSQPTIYCRKHAERFLEHLDPYIVSKIWEPISQWHIIISQKNTSLKNNLAGSFVVNNRIKRYKIY